MIKHIFTTGPNTFFLQRHLIRHLYNYIEDIFQANVSTINKKKALN